MIITGKRAFQRSTVVETSISSRRAGIDCPIKPQTPADPLDCGSMSGKDPHERFPTADLSRDLQNIRDHFSEGSSSETVAVIAPQRCLSRLLLGWMMLAWLADICSPNGEKVLRVQLPKLNYLIILDMIPRRRHSRRRFRQCFTGRDEEQNLVVGFEYGNEAALTSSHPFW
jgi:hypothetical protein